jgi:hypothetical protein
MHMTIFFCGQYPRRGRNTTLASKKKIDPNMAPGIRFSKRVRAGPQLEEQSSKGFTLQRQMATMYRNQQMVMMTYQIALLHLDLLIISAELQRKPWHLLLMTVQVMLKATAVLHLDLLIISAELKRKTWHLLLMTVQVMLKAM